MVNTEYEVPARRASGQFRYRSGRFTAIALRIRRRKRISRKRQRESGFFRQMRSSISVDRPERVSDRPNETGARNPGRPSSSKFRDYGFGGPAGGPPAPAPPPPPVIGVPM